MTAIVAIGIGLGVGLWALAVWLAPPRPALGAVIAQSLTSRPPPRPAPTGGWPAAVVRPAVAALRALGLPSPGRRTDLTMLDRSVDDLLTVKILAAAGGLLLPAVGATALSALGISVDPLGAGVVALVCAVGGFVIPEIRVRREAARRRADFRHALSSYLDLVVVSLAGGAGVDSALNDAAGVGRGWAFRQLNEALAAARLTRTTAWSQLAKLGDRVAVTELSELAASVSLAGTEGAKVRQSLAARSAALRNRQLAEAEREAAADTERMGLPMMALFLGFFLFITYPAVDQVLNRM